jgi:hypothetical protein
VLLIFDFLAEDSDVIFYTYCFGETPQTRSAIFRENTREVLSLLVDVALATFPPKSLFYKALKLYSDGLFLIMIACGRNRPSPKGYETTKVP